MSEEIKNQRESGIELYKIIGIIFIVLSHAMPDGDLEEHISAINLNLCDNWTIFILQIIHNLGQIGNDIFLVCSCWFLVDSKGIKGKKVAGLVGDAFCLSILSLILFEALGYRLPGEMIFQQFFPIAFDNNWYLSCYLLLYLIHPALNEIIRGRTRAQLASIALILFLMYGVIFFIFSNDGYNYSRIIGFVVIYFITAFLKTCWKRPFLNAGLWIIIGACSLAMVALNSFSNYIDGQNGLELYLQWNVFRNPFYIIMTFCGLYIALSYKFVNKAINYISGLSLFIYLTHANRIVRDFVRFDYFDYVLIKFNHHHLLYCCLVFAAASFLYGLVFSVIYRQFLKKYMDKISIRVGDKAWALWQRVVKCLIVNEKESR